MSLPGYFLPSLLPFTYSKASGAAPVQIPSYLHTISTSGPTFENLLLALLQLRTDHVSLKDDKAQDNEIWIDREVFLREGEEMMKRMKKQKMARNVGWVLSQGLSQNLFGPPVWKMRGLQDIV